MGETAKLVSSFLYVYNYTFIYIYFLLFFWVRDMPLVENAASDREGWGVGALKAGKRSKDPNAFRAKLLVGVPVDIFDPVYLLYLSNS